MCCSLPALTWAACSQHEQQTARVRLPRLRELSIRVALGAQGKQIFWAALGRMLILLATGSVSGILLGVAASRVLSAIVFQATAQDPFVLAAVALTILLTGALSVAGPVRRVLSVDPALLLRDQ